MTSKKSKRKAEIELDSPKKAGGFRRTATMKSNQQQVQEQYIKKFDVQEQKLSFIDEK